MEQLQEAVTNLIDAADELINDIGLTEEGQEALRIAQQVEALIARLVTDANANLDRQFPN